MIGILFSLETDSAPGRPNEDFVIASPDIAIVVDGAGVPTGGCRHGVAWYAEQLGLWTLSALIQNPGCSLQEGLASGIETVASLHADSCDLTDSGTPSAAIGVVRIGSERVDALVLSDIAVALDCENGLHILCDLAIERLAAPEQVALAGLQFDTPEHKNALADLMRRQATTRNRPGGWWVAAADPQAAFHADTLSLPADSVQRLAVLSDGATRPVDQMGLYKWPEYLDLLDRLTPTGLIQYVRKLEREDPHGRRFARTKRHDDATIAYCMRDRT